jgi:diguanylate cyclase (GGDEF)-like protein
VAALACAEQIRRQIAASPLAHRGRMLGHITVSLGLAVAPGDGPVTTILRCADAALLEAKANGRNRTICASAMPGDSSPADTRAKAARSAP